VSFTYEDVVERPEHVVDLVRRHLDLTAGIVSPA
jgi:hypothetical protein